MQRFAAEHIEADLYLVMRKHGRDCQVPGMAWALGMVWTRAFAFRTCETLSNQVPIGPEAKLNGLSKSIQRVHPNFRMFAADVALD